jgi:endoglucanase
VQDPANHLLYAAHAYFDSNNSGTYQNGYDAASPNIGPDRLRPFTDWLAQRNARGIVTEYGVPDNDARWIEVLSRFVAALDGDARIVGGTYWAGGPWWGSYPLAVEPRGGQDRPQIGVLAAHPSRN